MSGLRVFIFYEGAANSIFIASSPFYIQQTSYWSRLRKAPSHFQTLTHFRPFILISCQIAILSGAHWKWIHIERNWLDNYFREKPNLSTFFRKYSLCRFTQFAQRFLNDCPIGLIRFHTKLQRLFVNEDQLKGVDWETVFKSAAKTSFFITCLQKSPINHH